MGMKEQKKKILFVDDEEMTFVIANHYLEDNYEVIWMQDGEKVFSYLKENPVDLIILDIVMSDMDGFTVLEQLKSQEDEAIKNIPVIFLTGEHGEDYESKGLEAGAIDFITKPFAKRVLCSRVARVLELEELRKSLTKRLEQKSQEVSDFQQKASQDALTGLWNRSYTEMMVNQALRNGIEGALFMMDMDNFKAVNDQYGHIVGDETLKTFAATIREICKENDIACRVGGDEFILFVQNIAGKKQAVEIAQFILRETQRRLRAIGNELDTAVSIGIAMAPKDGKSFKTLYSAADKSLYLVKQGGKNSYHFYHEFLEEKNEGNIVDLKLLRSFLREGERRRGPYQVGFENFHYIYNFICRCMERTNRDVQMLLFTLMYSTKETVEVSELEDCIEKLEKSVEVSLRQSDVSARFSERQLIVMLLDADLENGNVVARRILDCYNGMSTEEHVFVDYEIVQVETVRNKMNGMRSMQDELLASTMLALSNTVEAKDYYTNGHSKRVAEYARTIAKRMGKSKEEQQEIYYAGLLHDVGKIRIPDRILSKPGKLTAEEFGCIKLHPIAGYHILKDISKNNRIADAAKWHHERYDGKGYPTGLRGEDIPEIARIIGVADAYDAMTSNRSYRPVMSQEKVRAEIEAGAGLQFDPGIAKIMLEIMEEDKEYQLRQQYSKERHVLVIDDEPMLLDMVERMLEGEDYVVHTAQSGSVGVEIVLEEPIDLVLLDIQMPEIDGFATLEVLQACKDVPVIFMTADKDLDTLERAKRMGASDYIVKPFLKTDLLECIDNSTQQQKCS